MAETPLTRWETSERRSGYGLRFAALREAGEDIDGEARLADVLAPRNARILDAGSGMGRVGDALRLRGHRVVGVDLDADLLHQSRRTYPELPVIQGRLDLLDAALLSAAGEPGPFDLIVCVGNVMILLAPDTERRVLTNLAALLADEGRLLIGFHTQAGPVSSRAYSPTEFAADAAAAGLRIEAQFATYDLHAFDPDGEYAVSVLRREPALPPG
ncbi:class I SAM-dependent methyltransferase [Nocardioides sp.]|uniref:class I SAM-dependent methyltransferase n=1 Tax=Nocardioides sp. TaxID=35761 RepID=UPI003D09E2F0